MNNPVLQAYSNDWAHIQLTIERRANLHQLNMNHFHRTSIDPGCLRRKKSLAKAIETDIGLIAVWFAEKKRPAEYIFQGRRMYRQYQETLIRLKIQIEYIEMWLDQSPPF